MFGSAIFDVLIGIVSAFLGVSLAASAITEAINSFFELRQKTLLSGVGRLLNDPKFTGLALDVFNHGLVNPLSTGKADSRATLTARPAYIDAAHFAAGLLAAIQGADATRSTKASIDAIPNRQLREALQALWAKAAGDEAQFAALVGGWFDSAMQRVGGEFKRYAQAISFLSALAVAIALNVDGLHITQALWHRPALAQGLPAGSLAGADARPFLDALQSSSLIGWDGAINRTPQGIASMVLGWFIVAGAALFGAPFWFDTLQRITQLRGVGGGPGIQQRSADATTAA
jgi:hypothetical protein